MSSDRGQGLVEYILIISLLAMVVAVALSLFGSDLEDVYQNIINAI